MTDMEFPKSLINWGLRADEIESGKRKIWEKLYTLGYAAKVSQVSSIFLLCLI